MPNTQPAPKESPGWMGRAFAKGAIAALGKHVTVTYLLPLGLPVLTGLAGYLQGAPWMWILAASGVTFGGVSHGLVKFDDWRERRRVAGKLTFAGVIVGRSASGALNLGLVLNNRAGVPIEFEFLEARSRLKNSVPSGPMPEFKGHMGVHSKYKFYLGAIDFGSPPRPGEVGGRIEVEIRYGRPGTTLKHRLRIQKGVILAYDEAGRLVGHSPHEVS